MREVIFRGRKKYDNTIVYGNLCKLIDGVFIVPFESKKAGVIEFISVDPETVQQYSFYDDSFGNKIFEGDEVKITFFNNDEKMISYEIREVIYGLSGFSLRFGEELCFEFSNMLKGNEAIEAIKQSSITVEHFKDHWFTVEVIKQ